MTSLFDTAPEISDKFTPDGRAAILQADTLVACSSLPSETFSLIISSPPYNIGKSYEQQTGLQEYLDGQSLVIANLCAC